MCVNVKSSPLPTTAITPDSSDHVAPAPSSPNENKIPLPDVTPTLTVKEGLQLICFSSGSPMLMDGILAYFIKVKNIC
jgi:hypothetical protein